MVKYVGRGITTWISSLRTSTSKEGRIIIIIIAIVMMVTHHLPRSIKAGFKTP